MKKISMLLPMISIAVMLVAADAKKSPPPKDTVAKEKNPVLAAGYEVSLSCLEDKNLNGNFRIDFDGRILLPYDKRIKGAGRTLRSFETEINKTYESYFTAPYTIKVEITDYSYWIDIRGLISKPGRFLVKDATTLDEIVAMGNGFWPQTKVQYVNIKQGDKNYLINLLDYYSGNLANVPKWHGGEMVFFLRDAGKLITEEEPLADSVQVIGEVKNPGEYKYKKGADFIYYLTKAEGPGTYANLEKIEIIKTKDGWASSQVFDSSNYEDPRPAIESGDTIMVHAEKDSQFQKTMVYVVEFATIISAIAILVIAI